MYQSFNNKIDHTCGYGAQARRPKNTQFNKGNVHFELLIRNNTVISNLGRYEPNIINIKPKTTTINEVLNNNFQRISELYLYTYIHMFVYVYLA